MDLAALPPPTVAGTGAAVPPHGPVETSLARIWAAALGMDADRIGRTDNFFDLGGHSLLAIEVLAQVRRQCGVSLPPATLFETDDLADLAAVVAGQAPRAGDQRPDLAAAAVLPADIWPAPAGPVTPRPLAAVLVTGATGFLGAHLVAELLARTRATVYCLVRAGNGEQARERVRRVLADHHLTFDPQRVVGVPGDLTDRRLGLDETTYAQLADRLDLIIHNGGQVSFIEPYHRLRPANVDGTVAVLRLAIGSTDPHRGPTPVHFVSTLGVFLVDRYRHGTVGEQDQPGDPTGLHDGYNQTKWVADALVRQARDRGVPVTVHRPARIGGRSRTGHGNPDDWFSRLLTTCVQVGLVPDLPFTEDISPVDYVAGGIVHLASAASHGGSAGDHHYFNNATLTYSEIAAGLADHGYQIRLATWADWRSALEQRLAAGRPVALAPFQTWWGQERAPQFHRPHFDCSGTEAVLAAAGLVSPPADRAMIRRQVDHLVDTGRLPPPGEGS